MMIPKAQRGSDNFWRIQFDSVSQMIDVACAMGEGHTATGKSLGDQDALYNDHWSNWMPAVKCRKALEEPPQALMAAFDEVREMLMNRVEVPTRRSRRFKHQQEDGFELDPVGWVQRNPDSWTEVYSKRVAKPIIRIAVNNCVNASQTKEELLYRGAAAVVLADTLQNMMGVAVEIQLFTSSSDFGTPVDNLVSTCVVKASDAPLSIGALMVSLAEIGFMRTVCMACEARTCPEGMVNGGQGRVSTLPEADAAGFDIVMDSSICSLEAAVAYVLERVKSIKQENQQ